jgi:hypothetical protein
LAKLFDLEMAERSTTGSAALLSGRSPFGFS